MTIPGTTETVLGRSFKSAESIKNYISSLKTMHLMLGVKFPEEICIRLIWCLGDWCALKTHAQPRTSYDSTDFEGYYILVIVPIYVFLSMFFLIARKSNIVPNSVEDFDPSKQLIRQDVKVLQTVLIIVLIKWSKSNHFGCSWWQYLSQYYVLCWPLKYDQSYSSLGQN